MNTENKLSEAKKGSLVRIESIEDERLSIQLLSMGCMVGENVFVEQIAPVGDPMMISIDGALLSLRKDDARKVIISYLK